MLRLLSALLAIKASEWHAVWYFFLLLLIYAFGAGIGRTIGMTLLVEHLGGERLPVIFILVDMLVMMGLLGYAIGNYLGIGLAYGLREWLGG